MTEALKKADRLTGRFVCPRCGARLEAETDTLVCTNGHEFPIVGGMPRFVGALGSGPAQVQQAFDFEHRRYEASDYTVFGPKLVDQFLERVQLPVSFFEGKRCLDVGCGSGRWSYALAELGADVTAVDLTSGGIEALYAEIGDRPNVVIAQADIFELPFEAESFDFVMSWGVLHHTPSTKQAFDRVAPLVRAGGTLYVMIYEVGQAWSERATDALRWLLQRVSAERRYRLCRHLVIENARLYHYLSKLFILGYYDPKTTTVTRETLQFGLYDAYSPRYNWLHSRDEVAGWFRDAGFADVTVLDIPIGAVEVRGIRTREPA
ncbi:MAG TPA: methyltransferase domain-containing protein [Gaiellaceae bacterium]|nr:methyltransferase domain-containing protein [Gaiellaceae bacterium]